MWVPGMEVTSLGTLLSRIRSSPKPHDQEEVRQPRNQGRVDLWVKIGYAASPLLGPSDDLL